MRWSIKRAFSLVAFLSIFVFSGSALASFATATAEFDWSGLNYTVPGGGFINWDSKWTNTGAYAENNLPDSDSLGASGADWASYSSTATVLQATATGSANSTLTSTSNAGPTGLLLPYSDAFAGRGGSFTYTGTGGLVTFSIPYTLSYDLNASPGGTAYGYSYASMVLTRPSTPGSNSEWKWISDLAYDGQLLTDTESGTAYLVPLHFSNGQTGDISFNTYSEASASAVPIPGALWLLGTGLIGLIGIGRRKLNARL